METFTKQSLFLSLSLVLALGVLATPATAAVIYSSETQGSEYNEMEPGSGENSYYFDMGNTTGDTGGPRVGGTFGAGGGINGAGGGTGGGGGFGGGNNRTAAFSSGGGDGGDGGTCTTNCTPYKPPYYDPDNNGPGPDGPPKFQENSSYDPIPEPATLAILGAGLMGLGMMRRRRK